MIKNVYKRLTQKRSLTEGNIGSLIWFLALPVIFSNILHTVFNLVDVYWVGKLGPDAIAALSMSGTILMIVMFFMMGVSSGTMALVSRFIGGGKQKEADNAAMQSVVLGFLVSIPLSIIGYLSTPWLLKVLGASGEVIVLGTGYMRITFMWIFIMFFMFLISAILYGAGDTFTPMLVLVLTNIINLVLDPIMIFGIGFPRMGVNGAAWATVISRIIGSLIALEVLLKGRSRIHVKLKEYRNDIGTMLRILKIGIPTSFQMSLRGLMNLFLIKFVAFFGTVAVAAYGIGMRLEMIFLMIGFGLASAAQALVGQNIGAKNYKRAVRSAWQAVFYFVIIGAIVTILFFTFAPGIISVFTGSIEVINIGASYLKIVCWAYIFTAIGLILNRSIVGAGDTVSALVITLIGLWIVLVPLAYYLSKYTSLGLTGIWVAIVIAIAVQAFLNVFWFQLGRWQYKKL